MKKGYETLINKVLSHAEDKDIAVMTAFKAKPDQNLTPAENTKQTNRLEADLNDLGYKGYVRAAGYWNRTSGDPGSSGTEAAREEIFLILNTGNADFEEFLEDMTRLQLRYEQPHIFLWNYKYQKGVISNADGRSSPYGKYTPVSLTADTLAGIWTEMRPHGSCQFLFSECCPNARFSDRFNEGGNFMTAMMYEAKRKRLRKASEFSSPT